MPRRDRPRAAGGVTVELDPYVVDTLMPDLVGHDRAPSAFLVYLFFARRASAPPSHLPELAQPCAVTLGEIAESTGLSKRAVQSALTTLERRLLVVIERGRSGHPSTYRVLAPWLRLRRHR